MTRKKIFSNREYIKLYNRGLTDTEIARVFGLRVETIEDLRNNLDLEPANYRPGVKIPFKVFDIKKYLELYCEGFTDTEIARVFGIDNAHIGKIRNSLDLESVNYRRTMEWTKEKIIQALQELYEKLGREPTMKDDTALTSAVYSYFGSFVEAKKIAGIEISRKKTVFWSKKRIIKKLKEITAEKGRTVAYEDNIELSKAAVRLFGSWWAAKKEARVITGEERIKDSTKNFKENSYTASLAKKFLDMFYKNKHDRDLEKISRMFCNELGLGSNEISIEEIRDKAHQFLYDHPDSFLFIQDGWAEKTFRDIRNKTKDNPLKNNL